MPGDPSQDPGQHQHPHLGGQQQGSGTLWHCVVEHSGRDAEEEKNGRLTMVCTMVTRTTLSVSDVMVIRSPTAA